MTQLYAGVVNLILAEPESGGDSPRVLTACPWKGQTADTDSLARAAFLGHSRQRSRRRRRQPHDRSGLAGEERAAGSYPSNRRPSSQTTLE